MAGRNITSITLTGILFNSDNKCFDRNSTQGMLSILPELISFGQANAELRADDSPNEVSRFLMISVRGLVYDWCIHEGCYNLSTAIQKHVDRLLSGLLL
ncbi:MAG: hypothetical protein GX942_05150 [Papillibacter sp.]|nr:hypothetical protein [Papillibacter sp.]